MKILWMSNSPRLKTGYGIQTANITPYLNKKHDVSMLGLQTHGATTQYKGMDVHPIFESTWGKKALPFWLEKGDYDILITLMDIWVKPQLASVASEVPFIPYLPVDSQPLPKNSNAILNQATFIVPFSDFSAQMLSDAGYSNYYKVPHGIDTSVYKPLDNKGELRREFRDRWDTKVTLEDKFIISCVGMNKGFRKGFDRLMQAFKIAQDEHRDMLLWIHADPTSGSGMPLYDFAETVGLEVGRDVIFSPEAGPGRYWTEEKLNELYNISDIHALAGMGEGFGLPVVESMSAGVPNVYTDYCTSEEFLGDDERGIRAPIATEWMTPLASYQGLVSREGMGEAFIRYYEDRDLLKEHGKKAHSFAQKYDWDNVLPEWDSAMRLISEVI